MRTSCCRPKFSHLFRNVRPGSYTLQVREVGLLGVGGRFKGWDSFETLLFRANVWAHTSRTIWCGCFILNEGMFPHFQIRMKLSGGPSPDDEPPLPPCHAFAGRGGGGGREDAVGFRQRLPEPPNTGFFRVSQQPPSLFPNMARPECVKRQLTSAELPVSLLLDKNSWSSRAALRAMYEKARVSKIPVKETLNFEKKD